MADVAAQLSTTPSSDEAASGRAAAAAASTDSGDYEVPLRRGVCVLEGAEEATKCRARHTASGVTDEARRVLERLLKMTDERRIEGRGDDSSEMEHQYAVVGEAFLQV